MKKNINSSRITIIPVLVMLLMVVSCMSGRKFLNSTDLPAAEAKLNIKKDKNNNYKISIEARHLASPEKLKPAKELYMVWLETPDRQYYSLGQIRPKSSKKAKLEAVSQYQPHKIYITAEDRQEEVFRQNRVVMETNPLKLQ